MLKNYIKVAFRNLRRQKLYSSINIFGLTIGLTAAILIILFISDEINFDKFNHNYNRIARLLTTSHSKDKSVRIFSFTPGMLGQRLKEEYPEVENYTTIIDGEKFGRFTVEHGENKYYESEYLITEPSFLKIFDFIVVRGNKEKLLTEPNEMVLTMSTAKKLFGDENPIGQTIKTDRQWGNFKVTGILEDPPKNSHLQFTMLISMESLNKFIGFKKALNNLDNSIVRTYLLFKPGYSPNKFYKNLIEFQNLNKAKEFGVSDIISLQLLKDIHFNSQNIEFDLNADARSKISIYILAIIGMLIILVAIINYTNLAAARSMNRMKEIGIRKVIGADRKQLMHQFLIEAIFITAIALTLSIFLVELILPSFNSFTDKSLSILSNTNTLNIAVIVILSFAIGILSGILPSYLITRFKTVLILKGKGEPKNGFSIARKGLVVIQFALSTAMIFCTVTIYKQMQFIQNKELGFNNNNMLVIDINSSGTRNNFKTLKTEFSKNPNVKSISVSSRIPGDWKDLSEVKAHNFGTDQLNDHQMFYIGADYDFISTFGISLLDGRNFHNSYSEDSSNVIINIEAASVLGLNEPIGKSIVLSDGNSSGVYKIIGVVKNFNFQSLHEKISPMIIGFWNNPFISIDYFTVKINGLNIPETIKYFASVQSNFDNVTPFEYNFLNERMRDFYKQDEREAAIIDSASALALLIACLGLFGLTAFSAEKRIKEIGVRKVLGASTAGIVILFTKDFLKLVIIAGLISFPVAYYIMHKWLNEFAYRINIDYSIFLFSGIIAVAIAFVTISFQAVKAAIVNPIESLRYE